MAKDKRIPIDNAKDKSKISLHKAIVCESINVIEFY